MEQITSYEELMQVVEERRSSVLTLEIDLGAKYSPEYEAAKKDLEAAKAMTMLAGEQGFLSNNVKEKEEKVAALKPAGRPVFLRFRKLTMDEWTLLIKMNLPGPVDQYEKVMPDTFLGLWGVDPVDNPEAEPISTDPTLISSRGATPILQPGELQSVVSTFISWQNSGGEISIRPTKSGQD